MNRKEYFVRCYTETLASLSDRKVQQEKKRPRWSFSWGTPPGTKMVLYDRLTPRDAVQVHDGLAMDFLVPAESEDRAIIHAVRLGEAIVNMVSLVTLTSCKDIRFLCTYEATEGIENPVFHHRIYEKTLLLGNLRLIREEIFREVFLHFDQASPKVAQVAMRAMTWLRKGIIDLRSSDQFTAYWIGLEALSGVLYEKLISVNEKIYPICRKCGVEVRHCQQCGSDLGRTPQLRGVKKVMTDYLKFDNTDYEMLRNNRGGLFHGGKELNPEFIKAIAEGIPKLRAALVFSIGIALGISEKFVYQVSQLEPRRADYPLASELDGSLEKFRRPHLGAPENQPEVTGDLPLAHNISDEGKLVVSPTPTFTFHNASFNVSGIGLWGDKQSGIKPEDIAFKGKPSIIRKSEE